MVSFADPHVHLRGAFRVLLVDRDERVLARHQETVEDVPLLEAGTARTAAEATRMLESGETWHAVVTDLGMDDMEDDEFYLLRRFAGDVPFVVCSAQASLEKGGECVRRGARHIVQKHGLTADPCRLQESVSYCVILSTINPHFQAGGHDTLSRATEALFTECPYNVSAWARAIGVCDREMRYLWRRHAKSTAKDVLDLYHIVSSAFSYHVPGPRQSLWKSPTEAQMEIEERLAQRFVLNRGVFSQMLCSQAA